MKQVETFWWRLVCISFLLLFITGQARANHLGAPYVGQARHERVWLCTDYNGALDYVEARRQFVENDSPLEWFLYMKEKHIDSGHCQKGEVEVSYNVKKIFEVVGPNIASNGHWAPDITYYVMIIELPGLNSYLKSGDNSDVYAVTY